ncbi:hypothetical protein D3C86_2185710 [compost metagenome]
MPHSLSDDPEGLEIPTLAGSVRIERDLLMKIDVVGENEDLLDRTRGITRPVDDLSDEIADNEQNVAVEA